MSGGIGSERPGGGTVDTGSARDGRTVVIAGDADFHVHAVPARRSIGNDTDRTRANPGVDRLAPAARGLAKSFPQGHASTVGHTTRRSSTERNEKHGRRQWHIIRATTTTMAR